VGRELSNKIDLVKSIRHNVSFSLRELMSMILYLPENSFKKRTIIGKSQETFVLEIGG